jgi:hypothetical protein
MTVVNQVAVSIVVAVITVAIAEYVAWVSGSTDLGTVTLAKWTRGEAHRLYPTGMP